jgi:acyl-CoA synthetase (AMP-forming)/AMP-acid ligase II
LLGEVPVAFVSLRDGGMAEPESLQMFCRARLPAYKVPVRLVVLPDLPKLGRVGKLDKTSLRSMAVAAAGSHA